MSIGIEIVVVYRNITDASNLHGDFTNQGILAKFKALNKKKDPLLEAVLFENLYCNRRKTNCREFNYFEFDINSDDCCWF